MKKITILTFLSLSMAVSSLAEGTTPVEEKPATCQAQDEVQPQLVTIGPIVITKIESNGATGYARVVSTGQEIYFINPVFLPLSLGQTVSAEIYICDIIDPPKRKKKAVNSMIGADSGPEDQVNVPYLAIIVSL